MKLVKCVVFLFTFTELAKTTAKPFNKENDLERAELLFERQFDKLQHLGCQPRRVKILLSDLLNSSSIIDGRYRPHVIIAKRCSSSMGYCGGSTGIERTVCQPVRSRMRKFYVKAYDEGMENFERFLVEDHKECSCMAVPRNFTYLT